MLCVPEPPYATSETRPPGGYFALSRISRPASRSGAIDL
jgi:hypothetical protein